MMAYMLKSVAEVKFLRKVLAFNGRGSNRNLRFIRKVYNGGIVKGEVKVMNAIVFRYSGEDVKKLIDPFQF